MGRPENMSGVSPTALLCVMLLLGGNVFAKTISLSSLKSSSNHQADTKLWDFGQIGDDGEENFAADDYTMGHSAEGVTSLDRGNNGRVGEPSFDNSLGSYFYSMTTIPEESSRDEVSPPPTTFSREETSAHVELHPRLHYPRIGESFIVNPTATFSDATSSDSTSEQKWALSPLDYLVIKQSRLENKGRQNYNKVNENEGVEDGSSTQQKTILSHKRSNGLGRFSSAHDNSDDVGRNGVKSYQGKVQSVFTSKNIKLETTPDFSASSSTTGTTVGFDAPISSVLIEVEKGRYDENQDKKENPTTRITERSESNTHTTTPFHLPYRVPFPYVSRANNEDGYKKEEAKPQNTNDMTDPSQTLVNKAVTLLQRRNRSRRNIVESGVAAQEEHETVVGLEHQHNSNETEEAMESLDHSQVANVKNTTHAPSSNPLEALERLTRLLEKMLRQLSQFRQKFTLRLIRMTEREDIDQMQEIMKDFDISGEKPIFFIAGGLRKLNIDTRTTTTSDVKEGDTVSLVSTEQMIATAESVEPLHTTTTIRPLLDLPETTILPVEPETETFDNEKGSDMIINRHNITSNNESHVEQISTENPSTTERLLSRHTRSDIQAEDQFGINFNTFPIPGRSARTENPYDDDDQEQYYEIFRNSQNFDLRYDGDSDHDDAAGESITSLNFSPLHPIDQSHMQRNDYIRLNEAISSGEAISMAPELQKASISPSPSSISHYTTGERILPLDGSITLQDENERSNDQGKYEAHAAGLNNINLASPSPFQSSNIDQDHEAHDVSIPLSRNNEELTESNPENLNLVALTLIENERSSNPVHNRLILDTPTLFNSKVEEKDAGSSPKSLLDQGPSISNESSKEQKEILDSTTKQNAEFKVPSQKDVLENKSLQESTVVNRPVSLLSENITKTSQTTNDINLLPGSIAKAASPLPVLLNKSNNLNHETPRRLPMIEPEENKKYNGEVVGTVTKAELQSNVLSAGEPTGESIKGTLPTPKVVVDMSLTSEGTPQLQRTLSLQTSSVNKLSSEQEISGTELKPISPLISNNAPFPVETEESFSGFTNKLEKRPVDIILDGDREAETDIRKKSLGESQRNLVAGESVGDMKKVGKNVEQQKIGKGMEVTSNETTFRPPTNLEKHQIMGNKTTSSLDKASNITFIQKTGIDTVDQSLIKEETDNHVRNVVVPNPPQKYSLHNSRSTDNIGTTQSIVAPLVSHEGVTNPTVTNTLPVETDKEKTAHPSVHTPTTQPEEPASQIASHETTSVLVESQPEPILDGDALLASDGLSVPQDKNIEAVTSEKQTVAEIVPGTLPIKAHSDTDIVPPVQSTNMASNVDTVLTSNAIPNTVDSNKVSPLTVIPEVGVLDIHPQETPNSVAETAQIPEVKRISSEVAKIDEPAKQLISNEVSNPPLTKSLDNNSLSPPLALLSDPLVPATNAVNVAPVNDVVHLVPIATTNDIVNANLVVSTNNAEKIGEDVPINEGLKVEPEIPFTDVVKVEPANEAKIKIEPVVPDKDVVQAEPNVPVNEVVKVDSVVPTDDVLKVESVAPAKDVLKVEPVVTVNEVIKVEPIGPVGDVVNIQPVVPVNSVVKVEPVAQVADVVKVEPVAQVADVVKVEPVAQVAEVVNVEPVVPVNDVLQVKPVVPVNDVIKVAPINDDMKVEPEVLVNEGAKVEPVALENNAVKVAAVEPLKDLKVEPVAQAQVSEVILAKPLVPIEDIKVEPEVPVNDVVKLESVSPTNDVLKVEAAVPDISVVKVNPEVSVNNVVNVEPPIQLNTPMKVEPAESVNGVVPVEQAVSTNEVVKAEVEGPVNEVVNVEAHNDIRKVESLILANDVKVEPVVSANEAVEVGQPTVVNDLVKVDSVVPDVVKVEPLIPVDDVVKVDPIIANNIVKVEPAVPVVEEAETPTIEKIHSVTPVEDITHKLPTVLVKGSTNVEQLLPAVDPVNSIIPVSSVVTADPVIPVSSDIKVGPVQSVIQQNTPVDPITPDSAIVKEVPVIPDNNEANVDPLIPADSIISIEKEEKVTPINVGVQEVPAISVSDVIGTSTASLKEPMIPLQAPVTTEILKTKPDIVVASKDPDMPLTDELKTVPEPPENIIPEKPITLANDALKIPPDNFITPATSPVTLDSLVITVPEVPIVADNIMPTSSEHITSPSDEVNIVPGSEFVSSEETVENLPGLQSEIPKVVPETPVEVPPAPHTSIQPLEILSNSPVIPLTDSLEPIGTVSSLGTVSNVASQGYLPEPSTSVAFQPNLSAGDEISIIANIPQKDPDVSFGIKPIDTKPHLQIPGLRPTLPERPHPEYLDFISQGVDAVSLTAPSLPEVNVPVVVSSPPVLSSYSPTVILKRQQQLLQSFFSGVFYRNDANM